jgi:hypothetical protein
MITLGWQSSMRTASSLRGEAAEDDRMDRAEPRAGQHRLQRLGHHRHVDDRDAVALFDAGALSSKSAREGATSQSMPFAASIQKAFGSSFAARRWR